MKIKNVELEIVCGIKSKIPQNNKMEIAFAGKSNVGKSSLINGLMNRKSLARTSSSPGKTQTINYYNINNELYFVDLPGYGYAKVSMEIREKWGKMVEGYLQKSKMLATVFFPFRYTRPCYHTDLSRMPSQAIVVGSSKHMDQILV